MSGASEEETRSDPGFFFAINTSSGIVVDCDRSLTRATGWSQEEVVGGGWAQRVHLDDRPGVARAAMQILAEGKCRWTCRLMHADGDSVRYHVDATLGADGETVYMWAHNARMVAEAKADMWQYERLSDLADDLFIVTDALGTVIMVNAATVRTHGGRREEYMGRSLASFVTPEGVSVLEDIPQRWAAGETSIEFVIPAYNAAGKILMLEGRTTFDEETQRWYTVERDVTDRVAREVELEISQRFFDLSSSQLALIGSNGEILRANPAFLDFVGGDDCDDHPGESIGRQLHEVFGLDGDNILSTALGQVRTSGEHTSATIEVRTCGELRVLSVSLMSAPDGETVFFSSRDTTEEQRLSSELLDRATQDQLTRLANRDVFHDALDAVLASGYSAAVIMLDLDDFKRVNDSLGHSAGDALLSMVGERLVGSLRPDDMVARFGGDEFVILLRGTRASADAELVAEKIRLVLAEPYLVDQRPLHVTTSLGVAIGSAETHTASKLFRQADAAAYQAKRSGRNRSQVFNADLQRAIDRQQRVELELRSALENGRIDIDVQGQFTTDTGTLTGVEALVRLTTTEGSRLAPEHFLDVARDLGLLSRVGEAVFDKSLEVMGPWLAANPELTLSLNADPSELGAPGFVSMLAGLIQRHHIQQNQLMIEVTESGLLDPDRAAAAALQAIRDMGAKVAIDDFGTGASSLAYLRDLRVDQVKVDRTFVQEMTTNAVAQTITEAVIRLGRDLGIAVVAEGVEQESGLAELQRLGCPLVQGYLLHPPVPVDQFLATDQTIFESVFPQ